MKEIYLLYLGGNELESLKPMLEQAEIEFEEHEMFAKAGNFDPGFVIEIAKAFSGIGIAGILIAWMRARSSRKVHFKMPNGLEFMTEGMSENEVEKIIKNCINIYAVDADET
jgi:hypothetical protein